VAVLGIQDASFMTLLLRRTSDISARVRRHCDLIFLEAAKQAGRVDNKVVSFSETHTALRLVIPRGARPRPPKPFPARSVA
jgi:hypothetical protein